MSSALAFIGPDGDVFARVGTLPQLRTHPVGAGMGGRRFSMKLLRKFCRRPVRIRGRLVGAELLPGNRPRFKPIRGKPIDLAFVDRSRVTSDDTVAGQPHLEYGDKITGRGWACRGGLEILVRDARAGT